MTMDSVLADFTPRLSFTSTVKRCLPGFLGVPVRTPSAGTRRMPLGSRPRVTFHTLGATPPTALSPTLYIRSTFPAGRRCVRRTSLAATLRALVALTERS
jgi:hypothetical protein